MDDLRDKIIKKAIEFRDAARVVGKIIPIEGKGDKIDTSKMAENINNNPENQAKLSTAVDAMQDISKELYDLLDELDVVEGRGVGG